MRTTQQFLRIVEESWSAPDSTIASQRVHSASMLSSRLNARRRRQSFNLPGLLFAVFPLLCANPGFAQDCPMELWVYETEAMCNDGAPPNATTKLYGDNTCRLASPLSSGVSAEAMALLPGFYSARCVNERQVEIPQSGCAYPDCSQRGTDGSILPYNETVCDRQDSSAIASFYSRLVKPRYVAQDPTATYQICFVLSGTNGNGVTFSIFGDCGSPACAAQYQQTSSPPSPSPSIPPTTVPPTKSPKTLPPTSMIATVSPTTNRRTETPTSELSVKEEEATSSPTSPPKATSAPLPASPEPTAPPVKPDDPDSVPTPAPNLRSPPSSSTNNAAVATGDFNPPSGSGSGVPLGAILGGVFGGLVLFTALLVAGFWLGQRRGKQQLLNEKQKSVTSAGSGNRQCMYVEADPTSGTSTPRSEAIILAYSRDGDTFDDVSTLGTPVGLSYLPDDTGTAADTMNLDYDYTRARRGDAPTNSLSGAESTSRISTVGDATRASTAWLSQMGRSFLADDASFDRLFRQPTIPTEVEVTVPPGKLGMVIDDPKGYPQVTGLKSDSVLLGQVQRGDRLLSIDGIDVTPLSCLETSNLIVEKSDRERVLVFCRGDD